MQKTNVRYLNGEKKPSEREIFDVTENEAGLKIYIKSKGKIYSPLLCREARLEREEFCASKFIFTVLKDEVISFNQGDAVCVKYDMKIIFSGYVFTKSRDKEGLIDVVCYDSLRYLKNRRSYTRGRMSLEEVIRKVMEDNLLPIGYIDSANEMLGALMCENVSLLDVIVKACKEARRVSGKRYIVYDDGGYISLRNEEGMKFEGVIDTSQSENFYYRDTIDENVYNTIEVYSDKKRYNLRSIVQVRDEDAVDKWGTLILSKKAENIDLGETEAERLLEEYNKINRKIVIKGVKGNVDFMPGIKVFLKMNMGDLAFEGYVRCSKAVHIFKDNNYRADLYIDGSELG